MKAVTESIRTGTLYMFAGALGVTTDYLLLGKETNLTEKESRLLSAYKQATDTERETIDFILRKYTPRYKRTDSPVIAFRLQGYTHTTEF